MSDHIDRVAKVVDAHVGSPARGGTAAGAWVDCRCGVIVDGVSRDHAEIKHRTHVARALDAAGLLATPAHDAALAARAWDEGFKQGGPMHDVHYGDPDAHTRNPYREGES